MGTEDWLCGHRQLNEFDSTVTTTAYHLRERNGPATTVRRTRDAPGNSVDFERIADMPSCVGCVA